MGGGHGEDACECEEQKGIAHSCISGCGRIDATQPTVGTCATPGTEFTHGENHPRTGPMITGRSRYPARTTHD
ncbi:hypothetical protein LF41_2575 [Lysobacter dokdonensis DS-58]|uniref:Uncharacterized protein n=1 Tax=Lysobacter dokdonensis DS-58 TaxID=1300345 RepID=A0A0A2WLN8_9GAMM|nr:hypothetical protein LF41_2575 [Lysobacter dokdonensis DS-58]